MGTAWLIPTLVAVSGCPKKCRATEVNMVSLKRRSSLTEKVHLQVGESVLLCFRYGLIALLEVRFVVGLSRSVGRRGAEGRGIGVP